MNAPNRINAPMYELSESKRATEMLAMLMYEDLARARMREAEQAAREERLARRLLATKRWEQVARWASRQAARCAALL
jgi:hypothetical protein